MMNYRKARKLRWVLLAAALGILLLGKSFSGNKTITVVAIALAVLLIVVGEVVELLWYRRPVCKRTLPYYGPIPSFAQNAARS